MPSSGAKWIGVAVTVLSILLAVAFVMAGASKLASAEMHVQSFARWGYPIWFMYVTGLVEVVAAILLVVPATRFYGAALLVCTMFGALVTHVNAGETAQIGAPLFLLVLAALVAWARRPQ